jgi:hypothetical protein
MCALLHALLAIEARASAAGSAKLHPGNLPACDLIAVLMRATVTNHYAGRPAFLPNSGDIPLLGIRSYNSHNQGFNAEHPAHEGRLRRRSEGGADRKRTRPEMRLRALRWQSAVTPIVGVAPAVGARNHDSGRPRAHRPALLRGSADISAGRGPDERRRKLPGSGRAEGSPSGHGRTVPRPKIATGGAPRGAPAGVIGR